MAVAPARVQMSACDMPCFLARGSRASRADLRPALHPQAVVSKSKFEKENKGDDEEMERKKEKEEKRNENDPKNVRESG